MKRHIMFFACVAILYGCGNPPPSAEDVAIEASRRLVMAVQTNATIRVIRSSSDVRGLLGNVKDKRKRSQVISEWRDSLLQIQVQGLTPSKQYGAVREVSSVLEWDVVCAMVECGCSLEDVWGHRFSVVDWLDGQICRMRKNCEKSGLPERERNESWNFYQAIVEYREQFVENYERFYLNERDYKGREQFLDDLRLQLSAKIGRRVRPAAEIKKLGFYAKQARARVLNERDAALKKTKSGKETK